MGANPAGEDATPDLQENGMTSKRHSRVLAARRDEDRSRRLVRNLLIALFAIALIIGFQAKPANAGGKWVGAAIAGAVVGGVIAHNIYRNNYYRGRTYGVAYPRRVYKPYYPRRVYRPYYRPVVVVPVPVVPVPFVGFGFYGY